VWKYGYYKETAYTDDNGSEEANKFTYRKVYSIPELANKFLDTGVFVGIGF